jgi:hypothetical protein
MTPLRVSLAVALVGGLLANGDLAAQVRAELRGGLAVGSHTGTAAGLDIAPSVSFEALIVKPLGERLSVYGGLVRTGFGCEEGFCLERDVTVTGTHGALGVELGREGPWLRLGALFGRTEVGTEGEPSDLGPGVHVGAGLRWGSGRVLFMPGASYRWLSANSPAGSEHAVALALDLGLSVRLGSVSSGS